MPEASHIYRNVISRKITIPEESNIFVSLQKSMWGMGQSSGNRKLVNGKQNQGFRMVSIFLSDNKQ
jgi:phosphoribosyl-AMP cyclohydrolase